MNRGRRARLGRADEPGPPGRAGLRERIALHHSESPHGRYWLQLSSSGWENVFFLLGAKFESLSLMAIFDSEWSTSKKVGRGNMRRVCIGLAGFDAYSERTEPCVGFGLLIKWTEVTELAGPLVRQYDEENHFSLLNGTAQARGDNR